jgi:hypothetical protein
VGGIEGGIGTGDETTVVVGAGPEPGPESGLEMTTGGAMTTGSGTER